MQTVTKHIEVTEVAKLVRKALKTNFPGVKFSVRSDKYSMGAALNVAWTDGPLQGTVEAVLEEFKGGDFNSMDDTYNYEHTLMSNPDGSVELVRYGADYIVCRRDVSEELQGSLIGELEEFLGEPVDFDRTYFCDVSAHRGALKPSDCTEYPRTILYRLAHYRTGV